MGQALPKPALRPFLGEDTPVLAAIFGASIEELTGEDYSPAQQDAWASAADDEEQFAKRLGSGLTLVMIGPGLPAKALIKAVPVGVPQPVPRSYPVAAGNFAGLLVEKLLPVVVS